MAAFSLFDTRTIALVSNRCDASAVSNRAGFPQALDHLWINLYEMGTNVRRPILVFPTWNYVGQAFLPATPEE